jgi:hypothetical protein
VRGLHLQRRGAAVALQQPLADVGQRHAVAAARRGAGRAARGGFGAGTVVVHLDHQRLAFDTRRDAHLPAVQRRFHAMQHRILDQRLQQQRQQPRLPRRAVGVDRVAQPVLHARALHAQVGLGQRQLVGERHLVAAHLTEAGAQVVGEGAERALGLGRLVVDQRRHVGQRVEQEMRLDLRLQQPQLGLGGALLRLQLAAARREVEVQRQRDAQRDRHRDRQRARVVQEEGERGLAQHDHRTQRPADDHADERHAAEEQAALPVRPAPDRRWPADELAEPVEQGVDQRRDRQADGEVAAVPLHPGPGAAEPGAAVEHQEAGHREDRRQHQREQQRPQPLQPGRTDALEVGGDPRPPGGAQQGGVERGHGLWVGAVRSMRPV